MVSDIQSASAEERRLLVDLSVNCEWPLNTDIYLSRDFDAVAPECDIGIKRYIIEFLQQEPEEKFWRNPKREIDRQFYERGRLHSGALYSIFVMKMSYKTRV